MTQILNPPRRKIQQFALLMVVLFTLFLPALLLADDKPPLLPYRVLLVADATRPTPNLLTHISLEKGIASDLAALMKGWSIPFDVTILSANKLNSKKLFTKQGDLRYGTLVWCSTKNLLEHKGVAEAVQNALDAGVGLVDPAGYFVRQKPFHSAFGLISVDTISKSDLRLIRPTFDKRHFITRSLKSELFVAASSTYRNRANFESDSVIASIGDLPLVNAFHRRAGRSSMLLPGHSDAYRKIPAFALLFRRAILWTTGYGLYRTYPASILLRMDDPGAAVSSYLEPWNFEGLSEKEWQERFIEPLRKHNALVNVFMIPGVPDYDQMLNPDDSQVSVKPSWRESDFVDPFGSKQRFEAAWSSMKRAFDDGLISIQSHGWTHMHPDLTRMKQAPDFHTRSVWYKEFRDSVSRKDLSDHLQLRHLGKSRQWLGSFFAITPLTFGPGGDHYSENIEEHRYTYQLAGEAGFALANDGDNLYWLNNHQVIRLPMVPTRKLEKVITLEYFDLPYVVRFHDRDLRLYHANYLGSRLTALEKTLPVEPEYLSYDQLAAYMHTSIESVDAKSLKLLIVPHKTFSRQFNIQSSQWNFSMIDELWQSQMPKNIIFSLDQQSIPSVRLGQDDWLLNFPPLISESALLAITIQ